MIKYPKYTFTLFVIFLLIISYIIPNVYNFLYNESLLENINPNEVPFISIFYIKPIITTTEGVIVDFYISDF